MFSLLKKFPTTNSKTGGKAKRLCTEHIFPDFLVWMVFLLLFLRQYLTHVAKASLELLILLLYLLTARVQCTPPHCANALPGLELTGFCTLGKLVVAGLHSSPESHFNSLHFVRIFKGRKRKLFSSVKQSNLKLQSLTVCSFPC